MSTPKRLQAKLFFDDSTDVPVKSFIPVFHTWIQKQEMDELLIDVHNYSHMHHGPGILLVAHESDFAIDLADGRTGLIYRRKRSRPTDLKDLFRLTLQRVVRSALLIEQEDSLPGKVRFRTDEVEVRLMDRLVYSNKSEVYKETEPILLAVAEEVIGKGKVSLEQVDNDKREPLTIRLGLSESLSLKELETILNAGEFQPDV